MVGGDYLAKNIEALSPDGRIAQIAFLAGAKVEVNLGLMLVKRLTLTASTLRARTAGGRHRGARLALGRLGPAPPARGQGVPAGRGGGGARLPRGGRARGQGGAEGVRTGVLTSR